MISTSLYGQWKTLDPQQECTKRHECGFVAHDNDLYLVGGRGIKPVEKYDIQQNSWKVMAPTPLEIHHLTPVSVNGKIYVVGGLSGKYPEEQPLSHVYTFDAKENTWAKIFEIPKNRRRGGSGVVVYKNKIYIVNGITFGHTSGTNAMFDVFDPVKKTWTVLDDAPNIRDHSSAVIVGDKLIALGGRNTSYHEPDNFTAFFSTVKSEVDYYDFKSKKWGTYSATLPAPSAGGGAVQLNDKVYYVGGETGEKLANNQMYAFDPKNDVWEKKPFLNQGRHGTNAVKNKGLIYIAAGCANRGGSPEINSIEVYSE
ncbi:kelch repeat-containing protein [uncultured Kriegella sp.]|uniref:Kelch repeat-containing protein n=1 Tax=uncultured Kriegella sp. TaxID=1798910 RepID=UPI0030DAF02B|tara:strand:- start:49528 stop:50463 length:936 start_codon:yes stop_codon:yes gene_type:complete